MPSHRSSRSGRAVARAVALAAPVALLIAALAVVGVDPGHTPGRLAVAVERPGSAVTTAARPVLHWPSVDYQAVARLVFVEAVNAYNATTTTTTSPPTTAAPVYHHSPPPAASPVVVAAGTVNGYPCGGDLPPCCTLEHESHGDPWAVEPGHRGAPYGDPGDPWHHASGLWQFMPSTWAQFMGYPYAAAAPAAVQNDKARQVFAHGAGASNWFGDGCFSGR